MFDIHTITTQAIHDALALRGLEHGGGGMIRTAAPEQYMAGDRLRLAREVLRHLPAGTRISAVPQLVPKMMPIVSRVMSPKPDDDRGTLTFFS